MKRMCVLMAVALLCVAACGVAAAGEYENPTKAPLEQGAALLPISLPGLDGVEHDISRAHEGGPVGIFFWSVFCSNCKEAVPGLIRVQKEWKDRGLTIWAVNVDGARFSNAVESFIKETNFPLPLVYDVLEGEALRAADPMGVEKTPTLYLADPEGRVVHYQAAAIEIKEVEEALVALQP